MKDRSKLIDLALVFAATFVIALAVWPKTTPRLVVRCNTVDKGWQTYSIAVDDPSLNELQQKVHRWNVPESDPQYVTAKWQKELAEFYQQCEQPRADNPDVDAPSAAANTPATATLSDSVTTASFDQPSKPIESESESGTGDDLQTADDDTADDVKLVGFDQSRTMEESAASPSDTNYWATVQQSAEATMQAALSHQSVPVVFQQVTPSVWPQLAFHFAFLIALVAACGYKQWNLCVPTRDNAPLKEQPIAVLARLGTFGGFVLLAMLSAASMWL
ncbi:hypothetical protein NHH03_14845 [Stieleria sp. TO1_6]|uniref:hypothetical protein n=1 Tax=Stieleria tagensis TaxID=2956795 RepID=UPI00209ADF19|nr:hypothetical protein [Stieleria tagensis]MCO8123024.1 hypothetical protein [Stieleria tagensis]